MQLRMTPRFHFKQYEVVFGFLGNQSARPLPIKVVNTFIAQGLRREQSPDDTETHSISHKGNYHIMETRERTKPNVYAYGFLVRTREPGRYPIRFELITDCGEGKPVEPLVLVVEERSSKPTST